MSSIKIEVHIRFKSITVIAEDKESAISKVADDMRINVNSVHCVGTRNDNAWIVNGTIEAYAYIV